MLSRINKFKDALEKYQLDAYILPTNDPHFTEEIADYWKCFEWLSEMNELIGAFGSMVVTKRRTALWVDVRYHTIDENKLFVKGIELKKLRAENEITDIEWVIKNLQHGQICGLNGKLYSVEKIKEIKDKFAVKDIKLSVQYDIFEEIWDNRPQLPLDEIYIHDIKYCGKSSSEKITDIRREMKNHNADFYLISALNDIAWVTNLRGSDSKNSPLFYAFFLISNNENILFINNKKINKYVANVLLKENIVIKEYEDIAEYLKHIKKGEKIILDPQKTNYWAYSFIDKNVKILEMKDITLNQKAIKNKTEIDNFKNCLIKDGIAMVKFIYWLKTNVGKENITELTVEDKLYDLRKKQPLNKGLSFETISAYKEHGAKCHYKANEESCYVLKKEGMLLVDSGGQYLDGTTDITRTIVLGKISDEEKKDYTLVLKALIGTASMYFREGTVGANLDMVGRKYLYEYGIEHLKGSCHGIGFFLSVHEFPPAIGLFGVPYSDMVLEEGMVMSNEPGVYKDGRHGIRLENMQYIKKHMETEYGKFYKFVQLTMCPFDLDGIDINLMNSDEIDWLNKYHKEVFNNLSAFLYDDEKEWLHNATRKINKV